MAFLKGKGLLVSAEEACKVYNGGACVSDLKACRELMQQIRQLHYDFREKNGSLYFTDKRMRDYEFEAMETITTVFMAGVLHGERTRKRKRKSL